MTSTHDHRKDIRLTGNKSEIFTQWNVSQFSVEANQVTGKENEIEGRPASEQKCPLLL